MMSETTLYFLTAPLTFFTLLIDMEPCIILGRSSLKKNYHVHLSRREVSLLLRAHTTLLGWEVSLLLGPDTTFIRKGSVIAFWWENKNYQPASRA